jgi:hypothetical protein
MALRMNEAKQKKQKENECKTLDNKINKWRKEV